MDHSSTVVEALLSPKGCALLAGGSVGHIVRLVRLASGWTQQELAIRSGWSQSTISRVEDGKTRAVHDAQLLADLAQALGIPPAVLGLAALGGAATLDGVDRRDVLGGAVGLTVTLLLPHGVATAGRIDADDVAQCWTAVHRLERLCQHQGGAPVYQVAEEMTRRLREAWRSGSYPAALGPELQRVTLAAMDQAGWLRYDAGYPEQARHWWLEARHLADLAELPEARVCAMTSMTILALRSHIAGEEVVGLACAARNAAQASTSPTLLSLLAAREALGHAHSADHAAAASSLTAAHRWLDQGRRGDEPFWLDFWGPPQLARHETLVALAARDGQAAETAARAALAHSDASSYPLNYLACAVSLGSVLTRLGQLDEAISVARGAVAQLQVIQGSGMVVSDLRQTVDLLGRQNYPPAKSFAAAAQRLLPASA